MRQSTHFKRIVRPISLETSNELQYSLQFTNLPYRFIIVLMYSQL